MAPKIDLDLAKKRFKDGQAFEHQQQRRELEDLSFYEGEGQWERDIRSARAGQEAMGTMPAVPARPTLTINKVREPIRHVVNEERDAELGVEIVPADDFGALNPVTVNAAEIELREGLVRRIQRESHAADARIWAAERAAICGRGYWGVLTQFLPGKTWDQEILLRRFYNQGAVLLDPAHDQPDGSDAEWAFVGTMLPWESYKVLHPKRAGGKDNDFVHCGESDFKTLAEQQPGWFSAENNVRRVRVSEYWEYLTETRGLALLKDGSVAWENEVPPHLRPLIADVREVEQRTVQFSKLDGVDGDKTPLEQTKWDGQYIPIIKVVGEEIQPYDEQKRFEGMVRPARDPQKGFNYMVSKWVEVIGLTPIPPLMVTAEAVNGYEKWYGAMATRTFPYLPWNAFDSQGKPQPPPTRPPVSTDVAAIASSVQLFDASIRSTTAVPDPTLNNVDVHSGKGVQAIVMNALKATSHYGDNFTRSVNFEGRIINDLLYPIYGTRKGRLLRMVTGAREAKSVAIGSPKPSDGGHTPMPAPAMPPTPPGMAVAPQSAAPPQVYVLTPDATFNVTIKVEKNYDTRREQESSTIGELIQADPQLMTWFGDLFLKYQDGPGHLEMADRAKVMLQPAIQALLASHDPDQAQIQTLLSKVQQLQGMLQSKQADIQAKGQIDLQKTQLQEQADTQRDAADNATAIRKAEIAAAATMAVAQAKVDAENFRSYVDALEQRIGKVLDLHMAKLTAVHDALQQGHDHAHAAVQSAADRLHDVGMAAVQHQQTLEQGQQAAALAPTPTDGGTGDGETDDSQT